MAGQAKKNKAPVTASPGKAPLETTSFGTTSLAKISDIDSYIAQYPKEMQKRLVQIRKTIKKAAPKAIEKISWDMPTFWQKGNLIHFAMAKNHIGLYPGAEGVAAFVEELEQFKTTKGGIQLPHDKELPLDLIFRITEFRVKQVEGK